MDASPVAAVAANQLAGSITTNDMSLMGLFGHADIVGKLVILGLLIISVLTWAIIFDKMMKLKKLKAKAEYFEERFWSAGSLDMLYDKIKRPADPMQAVFVAGMKEWRSAQDKGLFVNPTSRANVQSRIDRMLFVTIGREMTMVETWMTFWLLSVPWRPLLASLVPSGALCTASSASRRHKILVLLLSRLASLNLCLQQPSG